MVLSLFCLKAKCSSGCEYHKYKPLKKNMSVFVHLGTFGELIFS